MLDLNKYSGKSKSELLHSSGHAQLGQGERIGSTGSQTYNQRREQIERQGKTVRGYHHSKIGSQRGSVRPRQRLLGNGVSREVPDRQSSRRSFNANEAAAPDAPAPRMTFKEPPRRGYDPYA